MSIIRCSLDCIYQSDGYCGLDGEASVSPFAKTSGCVHYRVREKGQNGLKKDVQCDIITPDKIN